MSATVATLMGGGVGGSLVIFLAKLYLTQAFSQLKTTVQSLNAIERKLAGIAITLQKIEKIDDLVRNHEKKIAILERFSTP